MKTELEWAEEEIADLKAANVVYRTAIAEHYAEINEYRDDVASMNAEIAELQRLNALVIKGAQLVEKDLRAEIEGWRVDQKENLLNQCELQAEIAANTKIMRRALDVLLSINELSKPPKSVFLPAEIDSVIEELTKVVTA
jgi:SMC interacting uncharacterized protein involved in chromosome segregation